MGRYIYSYFNSLDDPYCYVAIIANVASYLKKTLIARILNTCTQSAKQSKHIARENDRVTDSKLQQ